MTRRDAQVGHALLVLGLVVVLVAVVQGRWWAVAAALGALGAVAGLARGPLVRSRGRPGLRAAPSDFAHTLELLRRAHGGQAAWAVGLRQGEIEVADGKLEGTGREDDREAPLQRGAAIVQLASADGRVHVAHEAGATVVAVGDFPYGAGLLLLEPTANPSRTDAAVDDLRRLVAGMRIAELEEPEAQTQLVAKQLGALAGGAQTLEGIARAGAELAQRLCQRGAVVVLQDQSTSTFRVVALSSAADSRLGGLALADGAPVVRAIGSGLPVVSRSGEDIFGPGVPERRRRDREGTAYPLMDGHFVVGALVLVGRPVPPESPQADQVGRLMVELGPRLVAAQAVQDAEQRAVRDPLTGLANRREFERVVDHFREEAQRHEPATLVYVDLDRFKALNDTRGHAAGDAALRHVATVLLSQIRDGDLVARIGGEEFAVWLPRAALREGLEVAERMRRAVETTIWRWSGTPVPITASCGVASYPDPVGEVANLRAMADAALYRAKQAGRNRVEIAGGSR